MASPGNKPVFNPDGSYLGPITRDIMSDPRYSPTMQENLVLGIGKSHRGVTYSNYDYRNFKRSHLGTSGRVK